MMRQFANSQAVAAAMERLDAFAERHVVAKGMAVGSVRAALSQGQPGQWATDHRAETEQYSGWNYIGVRTLAEQAAQAMVTAYSDGPDARRKRVYRKSTRDRRLRAMKGSYDGGAENDSTALPETHPYCQLLARPNPSQSGASFWCMQAIQLGLTGACIVWKVRNRLGLTVERYVIPTAMATPVSPTRDLPMGGYRIGSLSRWGVGSVDSGFVEFAGLRNLANRIIPAEDTLIIRFPHPLYVDDGASPMAAGALWSDTAKQIDEARWAHMKNGPDPSLVVGAPMDTEPTPEQMDRAATKFNEKYAGTKNTGKAIFVTAGTTVEPLSTTPHDMSYGEAFTQYRDTLCLLHKMPKGLLDAGSYASLYAALEQYRLLAVQPLLDLIADEETEQQATEFGEGISLEMLAQSVDDPERIERELQTDIMANARTVDEVREMRGLTPWGGARGSAIAGSLGGPMFQQGGGMIGRPPVAPSQGGEPSLVEMPAMVESKTLPVNRIAVHAKAGTNGHAKRVKAGFEGYP